MKNKKYNIDNDIAFAEMQKFHETKICTDRLAKIALKLIENKLLNAKYSKFNAECKELIRDTAIMDFLKYGHNFNPNKQKKYNAGIAIGYMDFCMTNSFNHAITKYFKDAEKEIDIDITDPANSALINSYIIENIEEN